MPTYREDLHLGHKVPTTETDDIVNRTITEEKMADNSISTRTILDKNVTEPKLDDESVSERTIQPEAVTESKIQPGAVTPEKLNERVVPKVVKPLIDELEEKHDTDVERLQNKDADLQNQIDSLEISGLALSNEFGTNPHIGISQQKLTDTINTLYNLLEEALGRTLRGFTWTVTPTYIYGEWPTSVHITAQPVTIGDVFEHISLKVNGVEVDKVDTQTASYSFDVPLQISANIHLDAQILGIPYYREQLVSHYDSFWLGAGSVYTDIMNEAHNINISQGSRIARNITTADNDHIFIIIGEAWVPSFIRADMNGMEIQFTEQTVTISGKTYKVLTSEDNYQAGTYNIDING